jgi:threonine dehydratase
MSSPAIDLKEIEAARERIGAHIVLTPLLSLEGGRLLLKCENRQVTGAFKVRGGLNKILALRPSQLARGVVAVSSGNHGQGVALAASLRQVPATVVVPRGVVEVKAQAIRRLGAKIVVADGDYAFAEAEGRRLAEESGAAWVSPYNDLEVIAGQATVGLELVAQAGLQDDGGHGWDVYVPVGGGGLACGVGLALRQMTPGARLIGVQPEASPYLHVHFHGGDMAEVVEEPTLADGLAGAVEPGSVTLDLLPELLDDMVLVSESAIREAIGWAWRAAGEVIEPSAAAALAACLRRKGPAKRIAVLSGGNIDPLLLAEIRGQAQSDG